MSNPHPSTTAGDPQQPDYARAASGAPIIMYTTRICPYCVAAKRMLQRIGIAFDEVDLSSNYDLRMQISDATGWRTVPMLFVEGRFVGGYDDLYAAWKRGELKHLETAEG